MALRHETLDGKLWPRIYKVVTSDMRSLGLRKNPNIMEFEEHEWISLPHVNIVEGPGDYGGIWAAIDVSNARRLQKYMSERYGAKTRLFASFAKDILFKNSYRLKTSGIYLEREMTT